jgi:hypothetical protein
MRFPMVPRRLILLAVLLGSLVAAAPAQAIVGGSATTGGEHAYPWQVAVISTPDEEQQWLCGGTLVDADLVLTAAHCVIDDTGRILVPDEVKVLSGNTSLSHTTFTQVSDVALYPELDLAATPSGVPSGDLALLRLPVAATGGAPLEVVGAEEADRWEPGDSLRITGWGVTSASSTQVPDVLRWANVQRFADALCASDYGQDFLPTTMICAGVPQGGVDTCSGDSGGPIAAALTSPTQLTNPAAWRLVGVTSWGSGCGNADFPGVYARLGEAPLRAFATDPEPTWSPVNVTAPSMPATATVGDTVTCAPGSWSGEDLTYAYEFHRLDAATTLVQSGSSNTYTVSAGDTAGIVCVELASNEGGTAWEQSNATAVSAPVTPGPIVPDGVPDSQVPAESTPRTPVPGDVTGQEVATTADAASPRASRVRATCASRRCVISVRVTDAAPSSGIRRVTGTLRWKQACVRNGRRTTCTRSRRIAARQASSSTWTLRTPRLPRGRASIAIVAVDKSGRMQTRPARLTFTVR